MDNFASIKILVVDDEPDNVELLMAFLGDFDYDVHGLTDSQQALAEIANLLPDLVLLDVRMPHINGLEIAEEMRLSEDMKDIPIIFVSAQDDAATMSEGFKQHAMDYIVKPIDFQQLLTSIQSSLKLRNTNQS